MRRASACRRERGAASLRVSPVARIESGLARTHGSTHVGNECQPNSAANEADDDAPQAAARAVLPQQDNADDEPNQGQKARCQKTDGDEGVEIVGWFLAWRRRRGGGGNCADTAFK